MPATSIDEVIEKLEAIIQTSKNEQTTMGYFAALYQKVTIEIKSRLGTNYFDDDERMEKLDVIFANRYLSAYNDYKNGKAITKSWKTAFELSKNNQLIVLQHLLLGINTHINLDLGIAASEVVDGTTLEGLKADFNRINEVLAALVDDVQNDLAEILPKLTYLLKILKRTDDVFINFSMKVARDAAWRFANELVFEDDEIGRNHLISKKDEDVVQLSKIITSPGIFDGLICKIIRFGERGTPADKINALKSKNSPC